MQIKQWLIVLQLFTAGVDELFSAETTFYDVRKATRDATSGKPVWRVENRRGFERPVLLVSAAREYKNSSRGGGRE